MKHRTAKSNNDPTSPRRRPASFVLLIPLLTLAATVIGPPSLAAQSSCPYNPYETTPGCPTLSVDSRVAAYAQNVVSRWMQERNLPPGDLPGVINTYGRPDLIGDIAAYFAADVLTALEKDPASRTPDEQYVLNKVSADLTTLELALYNHAVADGESFVNNPCTWKPDPEVAAAYGLSYDPTPYCSGNPFTSAFTFHIPGPKPEYLYSAAFKAMYEHLNSAAVTSSMQDKLAAHLSGLAASVSAGGVAGGAITAAISRIFPFAAAVDEGAEAAEIASIATRALRLTRLVGGGSFTIITLMIEVGIESIISFDDEVKFQQGLQNLRATRDSLAANGQDTLTTLTNGDGLTKGLALLGMYAGNVIRFNDPPNALPQYRSGVDRVFIVRSDGSAPTPKVDLQFLDHSGQAWDVYMWGNWFVRSTVLNNQKFDSITTDIQVTDLRGAKWIATRVAPDRFRMTQVNAPQNAAVCPTVNGISTTRDATCSIYFSDNIDIRLADGSNANISLGIAPKIESTSFYFPDNTQTSFAVQVSGLPLPTLQAASLLPPWLQVVNGATLIGNPGNLAGKTQVSFRVQTESGSDSRQITIYYGKPVQFISPAVVSVVAEQPVHFTIQTTGTPFPSITQTGWLPSFLSLQDNGNGAATLSGVWHGPIKEVCLTMQCLAPTITASNGVQTVTQSLAFQFTAAPPAVFNGPTEVKFIAGAAGDFLLTTSGAQTPVTWPIVPDVDLKAALAQLPWLQTAEDQVNGTFELRGTPPMTGQPVSLMVPACPVALGSVPKECPLAGNLKVTVDAAPRFMSDPVGNVVRGAPPRITLFVNRLDGEIGLSSDSWPLPKGLSLARGLPLRNGMVTAQIVGIPAPGQGGRYDLIFMWTNGVDHVNSTFRLDVLETASITSPASFTFFEGMPASGQVTTQGYPVNPIGVDCVGNICTDMTISLQGVPRQLNGLTLTDHSLIGFPTGVGQFGGMIPSGSAGVYQAHLVATNGNFGGIFPQQVTLVVKPTADLNGDGVVDCQDLAAIKQAIGTVPGPGRGFDLNGDGVVDQKDLDAMVRAVSNLCTCVIQ